MVKFGLSDLYVAMMVAHTIAHHFNEPFPIVLWVQGSFPEDGWSKRADWRTTATVESIGQIHLLACKIPCVFVGHMRVGQVKIIYIYIYIDPRKKV